MLPQCLGQLAAPATHTYVMVPVPPETLRLITPWHEPLHDHLHVCIRQKRCERIHGEGEYTVATQPVGDGDGVVSRA